MPRLLDTFAMLGVLFVLAAPDRGSGAVPAPPLPGVSGVRGFPAAGPPSPRADKRFDPSAAADTFRVVALLVQFPPDDDPSTTGNGLFGDVPDANEVVFGDSYPELLEIPRDPEYFREQLRYLSQYWSVVSGGRLEIVATVPETVFTAPEPMAYYGENEEASRRQSALFRDAVRLADGAVDFADFDGVFVYHAGCGEETDVLGDSPGDIWTAFLTRADFVDAFADSGFEEAYRGIPTGDTDEGGDTLFLTEGVVFPESETQDEIGGSILAQWILGVSAHMTGRLLGAPSLFDTDLRDGSSSQGIGNFGIMGTGLWNSGGILPPHPCPWTKIFFGWTEPLTVTRDTTIALPPVEKGDSSPRIVKVPITETEYWLIENRAKDENGDGDFNFDDKNGDNVLYPFEDSYEGAEFDWSLPSEGSIEGAGILIWHVDESVIAASGDFRERNTVNADASWKGVDLEEADGIQDLDLRATSFDNFGSPLDSWTSSNGGVFGPATTPSTMSNFGAATGVTITVESEPGSLMTVSIDFDDGRPDGWPVIGPRGRRLIGPVAPAKAGDLGLFGFAFASFDSMEGLSRLGVIGADGAPWPGFPVDLPGRPSFGPAAHRAAPDGPLALLVPMEDGGVLRVFSDGAIDTTGAWGDPVPGASGSFLSASPGGGAAFSLVEVDGTTRVYLYDGFAGGVRTLLAETEGAAVGPAAITSYGSAVFATGASRVFEVRGSEVIWEGSTREEPVALAIGDAPRGGPADDEVDLWETVVSTGGGLEIFDSRGSPVPIAVAGLSGPAGPSALADLDRDGFAEYLAGSPGRMNAINRTGAPSTDWPIRLAGGPPSHPLDRAEGSPAVADFDGDGESDVAFLTEHGSLWIVDAGGVPWPGFPAAAPGRNRYGLLAGTTLSGDSTYLLLPGEGGNLDLRVWPTPGGARVDWAGYGNGAGFAGRYLGSSDTPSPGPSLLAPDETFCYPNPVRGEGLVKIHFRLTEAAEVSVSIYHTAGGVVEEFPRALFPAETGEVVWDTRETGSGVYYARIEARSATREEVRFVPIAVLR
ncbi:MAG: hypothetical protein ABIK65_07405 [Candidatus Eisenbacteria bacterium]